MTPSRPDRSAARKSDAPPPPSRAVRARAQAAFDQAVRQHLRGATDAAEAGYREAIAIDPTLAEPYNNLAAILADANDVEAALALATQAVALQPNYSEAVHNVGLLSSRLRRFRPAAEAFRAAVQQRPEDADWWNDLGNAHLEIFEYEEGLEAYRRAEALNPTLIEAIANQAIALRGLRRPQEALDACDRALALDPKYSLASSNKGLLLKESKLFDAAVEIFQGALLHDPTNAQILTNLAVVHLELGDWDRVKECANAALRHDPGCGDAHNVLGNCAMEQGDYDEAMDRYLRAEAIQADDCNANWNQALIHLVRGDFARGWEKFDWRTRLQGVLFDRHRDATPEWDGSPLAGRSIVLYAEQGLGDTLQFIRYARLLREMGAGAVILECPASAVSLVERVDGVDRVIPRGGAIPLHDVHAYLMSLPAILRHDEKTLPATVPYLPVEDRIVTRLIESDEAVLKVGIVWAGGAAHQRDRIRSAGMARFRSLLSTPGVRFYSLQKGPPEEELAGDDAVVNLSPHLHDLLDTAAAISKLDLVISVDTSVAHLAGGLGCATWLLLPSVPDWRWMLDREDSPWYPTMRLFRQPTAGDWEPVFSRVAAELAAMSSGSPATATPTRAISFGHPAADLARVADAPLSSAPPAAPRGDAGELEVSRFIREAIRPGNIFIDYAPGAGAASLAAATASGAPVVPVMMIEPDGAAAERWRGEVARHGLAQMVSVVHATAGQIPALDSLGGTRCFLRIGREDAAEQVISAATTLILGRDLAAVFWPDDAALDLERMERLLPAGFQHCALSIVEDELSVDPVSGSTTGARVSIADWLLAALDAPEPAAAATATLRPPPAPSRTEPGTILLSAPAAAPRAVGIDWPIGVGSGWGTYGANLALELATGGQISPVLLRGAELHSISPLSRHFLRPTIDAATELSNRLAPLLGRRVETEFTVLHALGNQLMGFDAAPWSRRANVGLAFVEDTQLSPAALERGRSFDRVVAGSTWNGELLRAAGLDRVCVSLQGVDTTIFRPGPSSGRLADRFVIYSGGKLEYRKGQDIVVAAFREFQRAYPEALLLFAWHNHWPSNMEEIGFGGHVAGLPVVGPDGRIDFSEWLVRNGVPAGSFVDLGVVPQVQMAHLLREADAAVFTNRCEGGTNLVAMEAMACGIPTIISANTGHLDLVAPDRSYALERQGPVSQSNHCAGVDGWGESSVDEVVAMLERIHSDSAEAAARGAAAARFMEGLSWRNQVAHLVDSLSDLI